MCRLFMSNDPSVELWRMCMSLKLFISSVFFNDVLVLSFSVDLIRVSMNLDTLCAGTNL